MVYQGMEPLKPRALVVTRATSSVNVIGVFVNDKRIAREMVWYLSAAMELTLLEPLPRIWTRALLVWLRIVVTESPKVALLLRLRCGQAARPAGAGTGQAAILPAPPRRRSTIHSTTTRLGTQQTQAIA